MLFTTPTQFAVLLLLLVIGWLFGLASHPGGRKWKQSYRDEQAARASDLAERDVRIKQLEVRNAELVAERDRLRTAPPVAAVAPAAAGLAAATAADDLTPEKKRGWFDWKRDNELTRLRGVDGDLAGRLNAQGVNSYADLAGLSDQDELALEGLTELPAGYFQRERLREQARLLADGRTEDHERMFG